VIKSARIEATMALLIILSFLALLFVFSRGRKKHVVPTRTDKQKQADELITVILPTINKDN